MIVFDHQIIKGEEEIMNKKRKERKRGGGGGGGEERECRQKERKGQERKIFSIRTDFQYIKIKQKNDLN
jgi:hypothetical protein